MSIIYKHNFVDLVLIVAFLVSTVIIQRVLKNEKPLFWVQSIVFEQ